MNDTTTAKSARQSYSNLLADGASFASIGEGIRAGIANGTLVDDITDVNARKLIGLEAAAAPKDSDKDYGPPRMAYRQYALPAVDIAAMRKSLADKLTSGKITAEQYADEREKLGALSQQNTQSAVMFGVGEKGSIMCKLPGRGGMPTNGRYELWAAVVALAKAGVLDSFLAEAKPLCK